MTWNGKQGFQTPIEGESFLVDNMGVYGNYHTERGLTCESLAFPSPPFLSFIPCYATCRCRVLLQWTYDAPYVATALILFFI